MSCKTLPYKAMDLVLCFLTRYTQQGVFFFSSDIVKQIVSFLCLLETRSIEKRSSGLNLKDSFDFDFEC